MRIGLVGYGLGGRIFHAPFIAFTPELRLVGIVNSQRRTPRSGGPGSSSRSALRQPCTQLKSGVDAVVISTPLDTQQILALEAIAAGVAVVVDKPYAYDARQARELIAAAKKSGVALTVFHNRRWDSEFLTLCRLIDSGTLGTLRSFDSRIEVHRQGKRDKATSGGLLRDLGSHLVDQAMQLFGPFEAVDAEVGFRPGKDELDDSFFLTLQRRSGVHSHLRGDCLQSLHGPRLRLSGEDASYQVQTIDGQELALHAGERPVNNDRWGAQDHRNCGWLASDEARQLVPSERGRYDLFYVGLEKALRGVGSLPVYSADALACLDVLDAARRSARSGCNDPLNTCSGVTSRRRHR